MRRDDVAARREFRGRGSFDDFWYEDEIVALGGGVGKGGLDREAGGGGVFAKDGLGGGNHFRSIACGDLSQSFHVVEDLAQLSGELGRLVGSQR